MARQTAKRVGEASAATVTTGRGAKGAGKTAGVAVAPRQRLGLKASAPAQGSSTAFWFLKREGELEVVTSDAHNDALGITKLDMFAPTKPQIEMGIVCKIRMTTLTGIDENITIYGSDNTPGDIYLRASGARAVEQGEGQKKKWYNDRKFNNATTAQILSYVHQFVEIVE